MKKLIGALLAVLFISALALAEDKPVRQNKVEFDLMTTGQRLEVFLTAWPQYTKSEPVSWEAFTKNPFDYARMWTPFPEDEYLPGRIAKALDVVTLTASAPACDMAPRVLFIRSAGGGYHLYAFEFNVCDATGMLTPAEMVQQYIAKYGVFDVKDYDRQMIVYRNVKTQYAVGARPVTLEGSRTALTVTVADMNTFKRALRSWRLALSTAEAVVKNDF